MSLVNPRAIPTAANTYTPTGTGGDWLKGAASGLLGMPSDLIQLMASVQQPSALRAVYGPPQVPGTSEGVGGLLGANTQSDMFNFGLLGAPDVGDIRRLAGIGLLGSMVPHRLMRKASDVVSSDLTPAEKRYFDMIFDSEPDLQELLESVPGISYDGRSISIPNGRQLDLANYIDETWTLESRAAGGPGTSTLPPSFNRSGSNSFASRFDEIEKTDLPSWRSQERKESY